MSAVINDENPYQFYYAVLQYFAWNRDGEHNTAWYNLTFPHHEKGEIHAFHTIGITRDRLQESSTRRGTDPSHAAEPLSPNLGPDDADRHKDTPICDHIGLPYR